MPSFYDCFILPNYRNFSRILQRVKIAYADEMMEGDTTPVVEPDVGTWSVQEREFSAEELPLGKHFREHIQYTHFVFVNTERPDQYIRFAFRFKYLISEGYIVEFPIHNPISLSTIADGGALDKLNEFMDTFRESGISAISSYRIRVPNDEPYQDHQPIPPRQPSQPSQPRQPRQPSQLTARWTLKPFVARVMAEAARNKAETCPISLDSMASCSKLYVPVCGHVCSDEGCINLTKCPICRERTNWTAVEFTV
jgi:hypothetical protein